jgi:hypothetical protein
MSLRIMLLLVFPWLLALTGSPTREHIREQRTVNLLVHPDSQVAIEGSSNLKAIRCEAASVRFPSSLQADFDPQLALLRLHQGKILLDVAALDCGARVINQDMRETLKAEEFPQIAMDILSVQLPSGQTDLSQPWQTCKAETRVRMAGVTRSEPFVFQGKRLGPGHYRVTGSHEIRLSNYCLEAPSAMMGLIKVDDCFLIQLDLTFQVR